MTLLRLAPKYIEHNQKEFYCIRRQPSIITWQIKERERELKINEGHVDLQTKLWLNRVIRFRRKNGRYRTL